jgi:O-antigen ligase
VIHLAAIERGDSSALSFFSIIFSIIFICLIQFNSLPSGQLFIAPVLFLFVSYFLFNPASWLWIISEHRKVVWLLMLGPFHLVASSLSYSYWPWLSLWMTASLLLLPLSTLLVVSSRSNLYKYAIYGFIASVVANSLVILFLAYHGVNRPAGFMDDPNLAANFCALALLATLFLMQVGLKKRFFFIIFILGMALFVSLSRGALFSFIGALFIYLGLSNYKKLPWKMSLLIFGLILGVAYLAASLILASQSGLSGLSLNDRPESLADRFDMWRSAWDMFLEYPFLGTGLATFTLRYPALRAISETSSAGFFAHNDYLQLLVELGIVGFVAWFMVPVTLFVLAVRSYLYANSDLSSGLHCLAISTACLVGAHSMVNFVMYHPVINVFLGCVLGASIRSGLLISASPDIPHRKGGSVFGARAALAVILALLTVSFTADLLSRKPIAEADLQGNNFDFKSDAYYDLLALKYFSPLNVEIRNYLVAGDVNSALKLDDMPLGQDLAGQVIIRIDQSSWLLRDNCSQLVNKARLKWLTDKPEAIAILESILTKTPSCISARITLAEALIYKEEFSGTIKLLNAGIDRFVFRENSGDGPTILLETLARAYGLSGDEASAEAIGAYLQEFKRQRDMLDSPRWSRRIKF